MTKKRIGILTSGGDCAGLNAAIRAAVHRAGLLGWETVGLVNGTAGLMKDPPSYRILTPQDMGADVMRMGGTILGTTNKGNLEKLFREELSASRQSIPDYPNVDQQPRRSAISLVFLGPPGQFSLVGGSNDRIANKNLFTSCSFTSDDVMISPSIWSG